MHTNQSHLSHTQTHTNQIVPSISTWQTIWATHSKVGPPAFHSEANADLPCVRAGPLALNSHMPVWAPGTELPHACVGPWH